MGIPMAVQHLMYGGEILSDSSMQLSTAFNSAKHADVMMVRRPYTEAERAELFKRLVRASAAGKHSEVRELLKEGAPVNPEACQGEGNDTSLCLDHWEEQAAEAASAVDQSTPLQKVRAATPGEKPGAEAAVEAEASSSDDGEGEFQESTNEEDELPKDSFPCGGITPLMAATVIGREEIAADLRGCGAQEPNMKTYYSSIQEAFSRSDLLDVVKHLAAGADVNIKLRRGEGIRDTGVGTPLHACAALHRVPGAYEAAQYFSARELHQLYSGHGAKIEGPFYSRFGR